MVWRIVLSTDIPDGLLQINEWPAHELLAAHRLLDNLTLAREKSERDRDRR